MNDFAERESTLPGAFLFDLDGTLIDSVYHHVLAWREALEMMGIHLAVWRIHRRIGMSGAIQMDALARECGISLDPADALKLQDLHARTYAKFVKDIRPLPGATSLLKKLTTMGIPFAIVTSGRSRTVCSGLELLELSSKVPIITKNDVGHLKPDPELFIRAAERLGVPVEESVVVGDSIWDVMAARRARAMPIALLSGSFAQEELERAGAFRVYQDPADLLLHLDELGVGAFDYLGAGAGSGR